MSGLGGGRNAMLAGLPNLVAADTTTITAGADAGGSLGMGNLQTEEPSEVARLTSVYPASAWWAAELPGSFDLGAVALVGLTGISGDRVRFVGWDTIAPPVVTQVLAPTSTVSSTNTTATFATVDEDPASPGGDWAGPTSTTSTWTLNLGFPTPAAAPATGDDYMCFVVYARLQGTSTGGTDYARVAVALREGGSLVASLGAKYVTSATGQYLVFAWDAASLADTSGADVELWITGTPSTNTYAQVNVATWHSLSALHAAAAVINSGWLTIPGDEADANFGGTTLPPEAVSKGLVAYAVPDAAGVVRHVRAEFRADGVPVVTSQVVPSAANGFIDAGVFLAGPAYTLPYNFAPGGGVRVEHATIGTSRSFGGQTYATVAFRHRLLENIAFPTGYLESSELFSRLDYGRGSTGPLLVMLAPDGSEPQRRHTSLYCTVAESQGATFTGGFLAGGENELSHVYTFREKL